jgi:hypothetical protein
MTYAAKRAAEVAPGVGSQTDMYFVTRDNASPIPDPYLDFVKARYDEYGPIKDKFFRETVAALASANTGQEKSSDSLSGDEAAPSEAADTVEAGDGLGKMVQESGKPVQEDGHAEGPAGAEATSRPERARGHGREDRHRRDRGASERAIRANPQRESGREGESGRVDPGGSGPDRQDRRPS